MKDFFKLFVVLLLLVPVVNYAQEPKAQIKFETLSHDFGSFSESEGLQSYVFKFKNEGAAPLILSNVQASCGCTTPEWTRNPVPPGEDGIIKVSYNPHNRPGAFHKSIRVSSNAENGDQTLHISGTVNPRTLTLEEQYPREIGPIRAKMNFISFGKVKENETVTDSLEVVNTSDKSLKLSFKTPPAYINPRFVPEQLNPGQKGYVVVTYNVNKIKAYGFVMNRIYLNVDGQSDIHSSIGVSATIEEDFSSLTPQEKANPPVVDFDARSFDFGDIKQGDKVNHTFMVKNTGKRELIIRDVKTSCGCTAVTPQKRNIAPGESVPLKVTFNSMGKRGRQNKSITVITNDPSNATSVLRIASNVLVPGQ